MWFKRLAFIILSDKRKYIASYLHIRCIQIYFCSVYQDLLKRYFTFCFCCFVVSKGVGWDTIKDFIKFVWFLININSYFPPGFFSFKPLNSLTGLFSVSESHYYFILMHCLKCKLKEAFFFKKKSLILGKFKALLALRPLLGFTKIVWKSHFLSVAL